MISTKLNSNLVNIGSAKTLLTNALSATSITQAQYDTYYPMLTSAETAHNQVLSTLQSEIGHKDVGNNDTVENTINNASSTMDEISRSNKKYKITDTCHVDITGSASNLSSLSAFDLNSIDFPSLPDFSSVISWLDLNNTTFSQTFNTMQTYVDTYSQKITNIKNNVKTYIDNVVVLANNVVASALASSPCLVSAGSALLAYKNPTELQTIQDLQTGDKSATIKAQIESFKF